MHLDADEALVARHEDGRAFVVCAIGDRCEATAAVDEQVKRPVAKVCRRCRRRDAEGQAHAGARSHVAWRRRPWALAPCPRVGERAARRVAAARASCAHQQRVLAAGPRVAAASLAAHWPAADALRRHNANDVDDARRVRCAPRKRDDVDQSDNIVARVPGRAARPTRCRVLVHHHIAAGGVGNVRVTDGERCARRNDGPKRERGDELETRPR